MGESTMRIKLFDTQWAVHRDTLYSYNTRSQQDGTVFQLYFGKRLYMFWTDLKFHPDLASRLST